MPIYEYQCQSCGKRTEVLQRMDDPPPAACPSCGGEVKKLISSPAFQFKGSGWYATDYASKKGGGEEKAEGKGDSAGKEAGAGAGKESGGGKESGKESKEAPAKPAAKAGSSD